MSIRLPPPPPPKYAVFERVAPRYDASLTIIHRGWRVFKDKTKLILVSTGDNSTVGTDSEELIRKATETLHDTGADPSKWKDFNDGTYNARILGLGETRNIVTYDFGVSRSVVALLRGYTETNAYLRVLASTNCSTFTTIIDYAGAPATVVAPATARCLRLQGYNADTVYLRGIYIYSFEAYPVTKELNVQGGARFLNIVAHGYTQLLEVIEL